MASNIHNIPAHWPVEHVAALHRYLREGASVFEMLPSEAIAVQRYIVRDEDGDSFNETRFLRKLRSGVVQRALRGENIPSAVLEAHNIDLTEERRRAGIMSENTTTTTTARKRSTVVAKAKDDREYRVEPKGTVVSLYAKPDTLGDAVHIYISGKGNLAIKPNVKQALAYVDEKGYVVRGATACLHADKDVAKRVEAFKAQAKAERAAAKPEAAPKASKKASKKAAKAAPKAETPAPAPEPKKASKKAAKKASAGGPPPAARPAKKKASKAAPKASK